MPIRELLTVLARALRGPGKVSAARASNRVCSPVDAETLRASLRGSLRWTTMTDAKEKFSSINLTELGKTLIIWLACRARRLRKEAGTISWVERRGRRPYVLLSKRGGVHHANDLALGAGCALQCSAASQALRRDMTAPIEWESSGSRRIEPGVSDQACFKVAVCDAIRWPCS